MVRFKTRYLVMEIVFEADLQDMDTDTPTGFPRGPQSQDPASSSSTPLLPGGPGTASTVELSEGLVANVLRSAVTLNFGEVVSSFINQALAGPSHPPAPPPPAAAAAAAAAPPAAPGSLTPSWICF